MDKSQPAQDRHGYDNIKPGDKCYEGKLLPYNEAVKLILKELCKNSKKRKSK